MLCQPLFLVASPAQQKLRPGSITESIPGQFRVDIFVTHIWEKKEIKLNLSTETLISLNMLICYPRKHANFDSRKYPERPQFKSYTSLNLNMKNSS